jgi:transcriptional regulator with XRE-family HTH domain
VNTFGAILKQLRVSYGLTQPEFAQILSKLTGVLITRSAVSMWELGQRTPKMILYR